jgi:hypothetical protein
MYYKHDHTIKSQELEAIIVEQILAICVNGARFSELRDATQRVASFSRFILKKYLFHLIEYGIISYQGQSQVYVITWLIATIILSAIPMLAFAQGGDREMAMNNSGEEGGGAEAADFISHIAEDAGIFAIGFSLGLLILPLINRRSTTTIPNLMARKNIFISIAALTIATL